MLGGIEICSGNCCEGLTDLDQRFLARCTVGNKVFAEVHRSRLKHDDNGRATKLEVAFLVHLCDMPRGFGVYDTAHPKSAHFHVAHGASILGFDEGVAAFVFAKHIGSGTSAIGLTE